ncbi:MAG TPA: PA2779 family protein [Nitrospirota bacterium]|nr:PA2779 family protein [Nitrospirota bacterium]
MMKLDNPILRILSLYLVLAMLLLSLPSQGWAMFMPSSQTAPTRQTDVITIQKALESSVVKQRLMDYGFSSKEAMSRINKLTDKEIHQFAGNLDSLQAGADGVDALIFLVLVAIIVVVVLEATGHKVIVR